MTSGYFKIGLALWSRCLRPKITRNYAIAQALAALASTFYLSLGAKLGRFSGASLTSNKRKNNKFVSTIIILGYYENSTTSSFILKKMSQVIKNSEKSLLITNSLFNIDILIDILIRRDVSFKALKYITHEFNNNHRYISHIKFYLMVWADLIRYGRDYNTIYSTSYLYILHVLFAKLFLKHKTIIDQDTYDIIYKKGETIMHGLNYAAEHLLEPLCRFSDFLIVISKYERDGLIRRGFNPDRLYVVHSVVDESGFAPSDSDKAIARKYLPEYYNGEQVLVAFHGSGSGIHNRSTVKTIYNYVAPKVLEKRYDVIFLIIGGGYDYPEMRGVHFTGFLSYSDVVVLLRSSDLYIYPESRWGKGGTKYKTLEAAMAGLPVVITPELMTNYLNNSCPFVVASIDEFPGTILNLIKDKARLRKLGMMSRRYALENYSEGYYLTRRYRKLFEVLRNEEG
jgi:glycosyltransferase involved in cell wall biosynthesis